MNRQLFQLIKEAKAQGVPNDNIQRAIQRGSTADDTDYKEAVYEVGGRVSGGRHVRDKWADRVPPNPTNRRTATAARASLSTALRITRTAPRRRSTT